MKALGGSPEKPSSDSPFRAVQERIDAMQSMSPEERHALLLAQARKKVDTYNRTPGKLKDGYTISTMQDDQTRIAGDGFDCALCLNRGDIMHLRDTPSGIYEYLEPCKCLDIRRSIWRMRASGLEMSIRENTFAAFDVKEEWQQRMLILAKKYLAEGWDKGRWLYFGGQPGSGKTHLCTAVARELLYKKAVSYVVWPQTSKRLKGLVNEPDDYAKELGKLQTVPVLYIDDFFKPVTAEDRDGHMRTVPPSPADIRIAFEILNYRYINKLPTILSSEWHIAELADMDEATASRISERCGEYAMVIGRDRKKNHRLNGATTV